jgi:2-polyprenyl-6-methoxyphenol hydroxylase-like FAD-dependent oxidoreductase
LKSALLANPKESAMQREMLYPLLPGSLDVQVLIAGAGPIGLALAAYLGRQGVSVLLVERNDDRPGSAKMIVVSVRTMEFCRQLGVADEVRNWGFPLDHGLDSVFVTSLQGHELGRVKTPPLSVPYDTPFSPERERPCPQTWFDPILKKCALAQPGVEIRYNTMLQSFAQDEDGVTATLSDSSGKTQTLRARYLVGADGYSSTVRRMLGIQVRGAKHLDVSMSIYVTIPDLLASHGMGDAYRYLFVGDKGVWCVLTTIDGRDYYRVQLIGLSEIEVQSLDIDDVMRRCLGEGVRYTLRDTSSWVRKATIADRFMDGNVFIAGDAAHAHPPNGGLGMNTGILDAWDLGWKMSAVLHGWGGPQLLMSYDFERRPASARATEESLRNYGRLVNEKPVPGLSADTPEAEQLRREVGSRLVVANEKAWHPIGIHLGHIYFPSPVVVDDGTPPVSEDQESYLPTAQPGARAPHVWLEEGEKSTLDLFGPGFTLLTFQKVDLSALTSAAANAGLPLSIVPIDNIEAKALYEQPLVLVRPDGHVAWRGRTLPVDCKALIDRVRGTASAIAGCRDMPIQEQSLP